MLKGVLDTQGSGFHDNHIVFGVCGRICPMYSLLSSLQRPDAEGTWDESAGLVQPIDAINSASPKA